MVAAEAPVSMSRTLVVLLLCLVAALGVWTLRSRLFPPLQETHPTEDRVAGARSLREKKLRALCADRKLNYPPAELFLRAMKRERVLEVWAGDSGEDLQLLATYPLTAFSGQLGPKRREGDRQIPEGVYYIDRFNPRSSYHLSLGLNYPNTSDRRFADPEKPGSDIFIHGKSVSIGCLAIGDEAIEEVYILASDVSNGTRGKIPVHIFPARMDDSTSTLDGSDEAGSNPELLAFWENLRPVYFRFEQTRRVPMVTIDDAGRYRLR